MYCVIHLRWIHKFRWIIINVQNLNVDSTICGLSRSSLVHGINLQGYDKLTSKLGTFEEAE